MPPNSPTVAQPKPQAGTRVGNGSAILAGVDGRSMTFRRYREVLAGLIADMGGDPTEAQTQIARRAASLSVWAEEQDAKAANGEVLDVGAYVTASNSLRRLLESLGLERRARNITPDLGDYLKGAA